MEKYCRNCIYYAKAGGIVWICEYLLKTDKRRPCPFGKGCTVRVNKGTKKARELDAMPRV